MFLLQRLLALLSGLITAHDPGALVDVRMSSTAGVLLDEIPAPYRDDAAAEILARAPAFWEARARQQIAATNYRLVYRNFFYNNKMQLPLPPPELWTVTVGAPYRTTIDGHDLVVVDYDLHSVLVTGVEQPELAEKKLKKIGKTWSEPFVLPVDPDLLFDRTGYACMDEDAFPPDSVDSESALQFFDHECTAGDEVCHITTGTAEEDCVDALVNTVGTVETNVEFTRLIWSTAVADQYRVGVQQQGVASGKAVEEGLEDNRVEYIYFPPDDCAVEEQCIGAPGWRRLLKFTSTIQNTGSEDIFLGDVTSEDSPIIEHNLVQYSECHEHYHFNYYGDFEYGDGVGGKRAFCLESTARYFNNEDTPLVHPYGCGYQGVAAGWGDDYVSGIPCQWIDITDIETSEATPIDLTFSFNPDDMICEGEQLRDANGELLFEETDLIGENGLPVDKIACDSFEGHEDDNVATLPVAVAAEGSRINEPCDARAQHGPLRNCDLAEQVDDASCTPGAEVTLSCTLADTDAPQVLRLCESSWALDDGTACVSTEALANAVITDDGAELTFTCPAARDAVEVGGRYAVYTGALVPGWDTTAVTCVVSAP